MISDSFLRFSKKLQEFFRDHWPVLFLALLYLGTRILVLISAPLEILDAEEFYQGTAARELLRGIKLPFSAYIYYPHEGGAFVMTLLTIPFFLVMGTSFVALKLSSLLLSFVTFFVWYRMALKFTNFRIAFTLGLLFVFGPPTLIKSELMTWGHHNNICLPIAITSWLLFQAIVQSHGLESPKKILAIGVSCGFGMFFGFIFFPMLITCMTAIMLLDSVSQFKKIKTFFIGLVIGFSPFFLLYLLGMNKGAFDVFYRSHQVSLLSRLVSSPFILVKYVLHTLPVSSTFPDFSWAPPFAVSRMWFVLMALGAFAGVWFSFGVKKNSHSDSSCNTWYLNPATLSVFSIFLFIFILAISPFRWITYYDYPFIHWFKIYRYTLPLYPFLMFLTAIGLGTTKRKSWKTGLQISALTIICSVGLYGIVKTVQFDKLNTSFSFRGYSYEEFGIRLSQKHLFSPELVVQIGEQLNPEDQDDFFLGAGRNLFQFIPLGVFDRWLEVLPARYHVHAFEALGHFGILLSHRRGLFDQDNSLDEVNQLAKEFPLKGDEAEAFYRAVGWVISMEYYQEMEKAVRMIEQIPSQFRSSAYSGMGRVVGESQAFLGFAPDLTSVPQIYRDIIDENASIARKQFADGYLMDAHLFPIRHLAEKQIIKFNQGTLRD